MKKLYTILSVFLVCNFFAQSVTIYLTVSGGALGSEKWVNITTGANGTGTVVWAQGNGTIGNSAGYLTDRAISLNCGTTYFLNAYDKYDDGWDGTKYTLRTAIAGGGTLIINNSNNSPNDGADTDASSSWEGTSAELERSESFSVTCPCEPSIGTANSIVTNCLSGTFDVSLSVTNAGSGYSSVIVTDGTTTQTVSSFPTSVTFTGYTAGSTVTLSATNGTCSLAANTVTENCPLGFSCALAQPITNGFTTSSNIVTPGNDGIENWVTSANASCGSAGNNGFVNSDVKIFSYTTGASAGESFYFTIDHNSTSVGEHSIGVFKTCSGTSLSDCITSSYKFKDVVGVCAKDLLANTTYYIAVAKEWYSLDGEGLNFAVIDFTVETSQTTPSDECSTASLINVTDPYSGSTRCAYSASVGSPDTYPNSCGSIENDSWMKFTAGSSTVEIDYNVYNCTNNDGVQLSVFGGTCSSLSMLTGSCINYASNNSTGTWAFTGLTVGQTYYIRTDGYAGDLCSYSFEAVSGVVVLPIEMNMYEVHALENAYNKLNWTTQVETNTDYFVIEKSNDGYNFNEVERVKAAGNSSTTINYQALDKNESAEITYYRLKVVDLNGQVRELGTKSVINDVLEDLSVYPNPSTNGIFNLRINGNKFGQTIEVINTQGQVILNDVLMNNSNKLDLSNQPKGIYFVKIDNGLTIKTQKIVIK